MGSTCPDKRGGLELSALMGYHRLEQGFYMEGRDSKVVTNEFIII
jgi:hypothetical protein